MAKAGTNRAFSLIAGVLVHTGASTAASADVLLFDLEQERDAWEEALAARGAIAKGSYDLTAQFGDPGVMGLEGPVGLDGTDKAVNANIFPFGDGGRQGNKFGEGVVAVGPSAGFGNTETSVLANFFTDSFDFYFTRQPEQVAAEFSAASVIGSDTVDITVYGLDDRTIIGQFSGLDAPADGHRYGVITDGFMSRINLYDTGGGAEGITGVGTFYQVPAPGAMALLGAALILAPGRRRGA